MRHLHWTRRNRNRQRSSRSITRLASIVLRAAALFIVLTVAAVGSMRWLSPPTSAFMLLDTLGARGARGPVRYQWIDWADVSPYVALAIVAAEDQRFATHRGFDFDAIRDAIDDYRSGRRLRGASTISQQLAKNLFLWPGRSFVRKGIEAYFTFLLETLWPKQRILEVYMNVAELGPKTYGVGVASQRFLSKTAARLGREDAALLAAVLPDPQRFDARAPSLELRERQRWILRQMQQLGGLGYLETL